MFTDTWIFVSNFKLKRSKHGSTQVLATGFHISTVTKERLIMDFILMTISFEGTAGLRWEEEFAIFSLANRIWVTKTGDHRKKRVWDRDLGWHTGFIPPLTLQSHLVLI